MKCRKEIISKVICQSPWSDIHFLLTFISKQHRVYFSPNSHFHMSKEDKWALKPGALYVSQLLPFIPWGWKSSVNKLLWNMWQTHLCVPLVGFAQWLILSTICKLLPLCLLKYLSLKWIRKIPHTAYLEAAEPSLSDDQNILIGFSWMKQCLASMCRELWNLADK